MGKKKEATEKSEYKVPTEIEGELGFAKALTSYLRHEGISEASVSRPRGELLIRAMNRTGVRIQPLQFGRNNTQVTLQFFTEPDVAPKDSEAMPGIKMAKKMAKRLAEVANLTVNEISPREWILRAA